MYKLIKAGSYGCHSLPGLTIRKGDLISDEDFYKEAHRIIFKTARELFSKQEPIDILTLSDRLEAKNKLTQIGGRTYLAQLSNFVATASNVENYAKIIQHKATLRRLQQAASEISALSFNEEDDVDKILDETEQKIFQISQNYSKNAFVSINALLTDAFERIDELHKQSGKLRGLPSGFTDLDKLLAGFQKSDLIILAARPSVGKTALALDIARQAAVYHNIPVGIFSLEMSSQQLVDRMLASQSNVDAWKLRTGKGIKEDDFSAIRQSLDTLSKAPIFIDDQPGNNILKMRSVARRLKNEKGLGLIVVDYLQLIMTTKNYDSMVNQVTEISRSLKNLARELEVPVLALSQLSRAIEQRGGRPKLSDLRDSGSIEQDADVVMFIHREDKNKSTGDDSEKTNIAEILIEKHRNGATGKVDLFFNDKKACFLPLEKAQFSGAESEFREF